MAADFHRPARRPSSAFEAFIGGDDPAAQARVAHDTAAALLARVRSDPDPKIVERLVAYTDVHGIDAIAELWSRASARSLPGALWRIYLLRTLIRQDPTGTSFAYQRGTEITHTIDTVVAGAESPTGPGEVVDLADRILRGLFAGDFGVALDRAAAFCRVSASGCASLADDSEVADGERAGIFTTRALRFSTIAEELTSCARLWRAGSLE